MDLEGIMLSEIYQTEKDKYCMISPICGIFKKPKLIEKNRLAFARGRGWDGGAGRETVTVVKRYKLPVLFLISPGDVMYSMETIVNNTVLYI